jgi:hypothetical protein
LHPYAYVLTAYCAALLLLLLLLLAGGHATQTIVTYLRYFLEQEWLAQQRKKEAADAAAAPTAGRESSPAEQQQQQQAELQEPPVPFDYKVWPLCPCQLLALLHGSCAAPSLHPQGCMHGGALLSACCAGSSVAILTVSCD